MNDKHTNYIKHIKQRFRTQAGSQILRMTYALNPKCIFPQRRNRYSLRKRGPTFLLNCPFCDAHDAPSGKRVVRHPHKKLLSSELLGEGDDDLVQELKRWRKFAEL